MKPEQGRKSGFDGIDPGSAMKRKDGEVSTSKYYHCYYYYLLLTPAKELEQENQGLTGLERQL